MREAISHAVETDREFKRKSSGPGGERAGKLLVVATVVLLAVTSYSWIVKPQAIWGAPAKPPAPEVQQANLRMSMFLFGMKVDRFKTKSGSYPESLAEMGDSVPGIGYARLSDAAFELRGRAANREIVFRSDMRGDEFLGNARELIQSRPRR